MTWNQIRQRGLAWRCLRHELKLDGGRPFFPFGVRFFIQVKHRAIGRNLLKIGRGSKGDAAADEGLSGLGGDFRAAEQTEVKINAAGIPKFGIHPHQRSVILINAGLDENFARVVAESAIEHLANLNAAIKNRRKGLGRLARSTDEQGPSAEFDIS